MTLLSPVAAIPYPALTDAPNMQTAMATMTSSLDSMVVPRYSTLAILTAAVPTPTTGQQVFLTGSNAFVYWNGTAWVASGVALISQTTLGSAVASVTLSSIPAVFTHLRLMCSNIRSAAGTQASSGDLILARFNGDSGSNYVSEGWNPETPTTVAALTTSSAAAAAGSAANIGYSATANASAGVVACSIADIYSYSSTSLKKLCTYQGTINGATTGNGMALGGSGWTSTAAITSITLILATSAGSGVTNFNAGAVFSLYGIP